MSQTRQPLLEL
ncbi:hypothetical protein AX774_g4539, partial [Zancudomyces culisetae]